MLDGCSDNPYRGHRFPREIISYAVWFYYRSVGFRDIEEAWRVGYLPRYGGNASLRGAGVAEVVVKPTGAQPKRLRY